MEVEQPGFWVTLAANEEFWKQIPYWVTAIAAVGGSLLGALVGSRLQHSAALARERESRRRQHLERVAEIANTILSVGISYQATAKSISQRIQEKGGSQYDYPDLLPPFVKKHRELEQASRATLEASSLLRLIDEPDVLKAFDDVHDASSKLQECGADLARFTPHDIEARVYLLSEKLSKLISCVQKAWAKDSKDASARSGKRASKAQYLLAATLAGLIFTLPSLPSEAAEAFASRVVDRDTIEVADQTVRLQGIDAPESRQLHGNQATAALKSLILHRTVRLDVSGTDRYGRLIAVVYRGERNVNRWLVQQGHAWEYDRYSEDQLLGQLESHARRAKRGLWRRVIQCLLGSGGTGLEHPAIKTGIAPTFMLSVRLRDSTSGVVRVTPSA